MINKTILVTGGAGFIGSHLVEKLLNLGYKVVCVDNFNDFYSLDIKVSNIFESVGVPKSINSYKDKNEVILKLQKVVNKCMYTLEYIDIRDKQLFKSILKKHNPDIIINLAAMAGVRPSIDDPLLYQNVNVNGFLNILESCKELGINKIIQASSSSVYGNNKKIPFSENDNVDFPISPYASTKKQCEIMSYPYYHLYNMSILHLRFFTVYGSRQRPDLAIHKFIKFIDEGKSVPFFGDGSTKRDYTYIDDIIDGILKSIDYIMSVDKVYDIFNLGESDTISLRNMVNCIETTLGKKANLENFPMQPGDVSLTNADIMKSKSYLGYNPKTKFDDGIKKFIKWYKFK